MPRGSGYTTIRPVLTDSRARWLRLLQMGPAMRQDTYGRAPTDCVHLGWSRFDGGLHRITRKGRRVMAGEVSRG